MLLVFHFAALGVNLLAAPSGPWPSMDGVDLAGPPHLFQLAQEQGALAYLSWIKMTHNYHFPSNRPGQPAAALDVRLLDDRGELIATVRFPDPNASAWVRQRQALATRWLTDDHPVAPPRGERIAAPGQKAPETMVWAPAGEERRLELRRIPEHEVPRDRPVFAPSDWSLVVVRSFARRLCRVHGAQAAEVVRHSREAVGSRVLLEREAPPAMDDLHSAYGRFPR